MKSLGKPRIYRTVQLPGDTCIHVFLTTRSVLKSEGIGDRDYKTGMPTSLTTCVVENWKIEQFKFWRKQLCANQFKARR